MKKKRVTYLWIEPWRPQASAKIVAQKSKARLRELSSDIQCEKEYVKSNQYSGFIEKNIDTLLRKFN
jgi:ABC-type Zn uptake system ZnuABC Zn-binding protein ZnuA